MSGSAVHALWPGERHKLVDVSIGSAEVLPAGAGLAQQLDTRLPQLRDRLGQVRNLEALDGTPILDIKPLLGEPNER